nr:hypothetical protein [Tanacetum cinerariifolium]
RSSWVPPQPPLVEAAAAIRQPKKSPYVKERQQHPKSDMVYFRCLDSSTVSMTHLNRDVNPK